MTFIVYFVPESELLELLLVRGHQLHQRRLLLATVQCDAIRSEQFFEDVVLDRFNMAYRDEDIILDQIYKNQIFWILYFEDFKS